MPSPAVKPTRAERFAGLSVAIVTPFRDGKIDSPRLRQQIDAQAAAGVTCICPVGTTGESPTLSHDEHERVIAESIQASAGRILVMPGTGSNSTAEAVRLTKHAAKEGASAALVVGPYYNRPTQQGIYEHFKALAEAVSTVETRASIAGCRLPRLSGARSASRSRTARTSAGSIPALPSTGAVDRRGQRCPTIIFLPDGQDSSPPPTAKPTLFMCRRTMG